MSQLLKALVVLALLCASAALGFLVRSRMPEPQRSKESTEFIELTIVLLVTIAAVVLGLQTTSVKSAFDIAEHDRANYAAQLTLLDQCMRNYGPGSELVRRHLQSFTAAAIASNWRSEVAPPGVSYPDVSKMSRDSARSVLTDLMNHIGLEIRQLNPPDQLHGKLAADCFDQFKDVVRARSSIIEEPYSSIARPFLRMLVFWLMVIFACFGLRAPASPLVLIVIALSAISLSSTMFIILDMDMPYEGLFKISSQTMRTALSDMLR